MVRQKQSIPVEEYRDERTGEAITIYYNPNPNKHWHEAAIDPGTGKNVKPWEAKHVQGVPVTFIDRDIDKVRQWIKARLEEVTAIVWQGVIRVEVGAPPSRARTIDGTQVYLSLTVDRFWVAQLGNGALLKAKWEEANEPAGGPGRPGPDEDMRSFRATNWQWRESRPFAVPLSVQASYDGDRWKHFYAYSDELWAGLTAIVAQVEMASGALALLTTTEGDGYLRLAESGARSLLALPAPVAP